MNAMLGPADVDRVASDHTDDPASSYSLHAEAYTDQRWYDLEQRAVFGRTWQWVCHMEKLINAGDYVTTTIAGNPIVAVRDRDGRLRAFYNVCKHRAHQVISDEGSTRSLTCPYHGWVYDLGGSLIAGRHTKNLVDFDLGDHCLDAVQAEEFAGFVFVNLDPEAAPLHEWSGALGDEIHAWAPDIPTLTHAKRLTYDIASNWKNVVDNFLECYHCHVAHKDFVSLVDMSTYTVTTHGIYSSHMAEAGKSGNSAYDVSDATVQDHAVWWLWPNTCMMRYPGRGNFIILHIIPVGPDRTYETYDFFLEEPDPNQAEVDAVRYIDDVLQPEDIAICESVQRGMSTPAFTAGRLVTDPEGSGLSEHGLHHFHGLLIDSYRRQLGEPVDS